MNRMRRVHAVLGAAVVVSACNPPQAEFTDTHRTAVRDSVAAVMASFQRYSGAAQWDSLASLYSGDPGFRFAESGDIRYRSADAIRQAFASVPPGTRIETTYRDTHVDPLAPGVASVTTLFDTAFVDSLGGRFSFGGAITMLWVHEEAGWRIRNGHSSAPVPRGG